MTDALKRTLRSFGELLGNCIYDKRYLQEIANKKRKYVSTTSIRLVYAN